MLKCYYAHCQSIFNTPQEERDVKTLKSLGFAVYNPNNPEASDAYKKYGMQWFVDFVKTATDVFAYRSLPDGSIPTGVAKELEAAKEAGLAIIQLPRATARVLSVEETRNYLREVGQR